MFRLPSYTIKTIKKGKTRYHRLVVATKTGSRTLEGPDKSTLINQAIEYFGEDIPDDNSQLFNDKDPDPKPFTGKKRSLKGVDD